MEYLAHDFQMDILESEKDIIFAGCGVGSGKTDVGSSWVLKKAKQTPQNTIAIIAANTYTQLIDSTMRNIYKNFHQWGVTFRPYQLPRTHRPFNIFIWNGSHWVEILCRSLDAFETLSGTHVGWVWADEVWQTKKEAIDLLSARNRDNKLMHNQMLLTTTLDDPDTWLYEMFVDKYNEMLMDVIYATTYVNEENLPDGYIDKLKILYTKAMFDRMVLAKWVTLSGSLVYSNFDRDIHRQSYAEFDPNSPICWTHDFNIGEGKPMSSCLCHIKKGKDKKGRKRPEIHVFDELILESTDTNDAVKEFKNRAWLNKTNSNVIIYGDATGRSRDTRSKTTDYKIIADAGFRNQQVPRSNPPIRTRHNDVNAMLKNAEDDVRLVIHPRCKVLLKGLETVKLRKGAQYLEEETYAQHVTTALGYLICREFSTDRRPATVQEVR